MKTSSGSPRLLLLLLALAATAARADLRDGFLTALLTAEKDIVTNTDVLDADAPQPAPGAPVYYLPVPKGYRDFGFAMAGEKAPESAAVLRMVTKILETQGYQLASTARAPQIMILYSWGTFHLNRNPGAHTYALEMLDFLGANKVGLRTDARSNAFPEQGLGLSLQTADADMLMGFLDHGLYVITFRAYDYESARKGVAKLLWKTNVSGSTRGFYLPDILPTMLAVAAPHLGRETHRPIRVEVENRYVPKVELGPLQVIEEDVRPKNHN